MKVPMLVGLLLLAYLATRKRKPITALRPDEDCMSPSWIVENVYRSAHDGDAP